MKLKPLQRSIAAFALCAVLPFGVMAQKKDPVQIGLVTSKSGTFAGQGEEIARGIQFAIEEANAKGGVDGREVKYQFADDESTPDSGRRVAEKLARDGYNLLIGAVPSSISMAFGANLDRWDAAYFVTASKVDAITGKNCNARMIRTNHSDAIDLAMIKEWSKSFNDKTYATIAADYSWGRDSSESFKKAVEASGKTVKLSLFAPLGTKDFSPYIAQLKEANVDAIWVAEVGRDAIAFAKQAQEFGLVPAKKLIGHSLVVNFIIDGSGTALENLIGTATYVPEIDTPRNKAFVAAWRAKFKRVPTDNEAQGYHGTQVIFEGVKRSGSVKPADVTKAVRGATFDTIYGNVTVRAADNQMVLPTYSGVVKKVDGALRPVLDKAFPASLVPAASPDCKII